MPATKLRRAPLANVSSPSPPATIRLVTRMPRALIHFHLSLLEFIVLKGCCYPSRGSSRTYMKSIAATAEHTRPCVPSQTGNHIFTIVEAAWRHINVAANLKKQSCSNDVQDFVFVMANFVDTTVLKCTTCPK